MFLHDEVVLSVERHDAEDRLAAVATAKSFHWRFPSGVVIPIEAVPHGHQGRRWSDLC
jgi:hypothetical protein